MGILLGEKIEDVKGPYIHFNLKNQDKGAYGSQMIEPTMGRAQVVVGFYDNNDGTSQFSDAPQQYLAVKAVKSSIETLLKEIYLNEKAPPIFLHDA